MLVPSGHGVVPWPLLVEVGGRMEDLLDLHLPLPIVPGEGEGLGLIYHLWESQVPQVPVRGAGHALQQPTQGHPEAVAHVGGGQLLDRPQPPPTQHVKPSMLVLLPQSRHQAVYMGFMGAWPLMTVAVQEHLVIINRHLYILLLLTLSSWCRWDRWSLGEEKLVQVVHGDVGCHMLPVWNNSDELFQRPFVHGLKIHRVALHGGFEKSVTNICHIFP